MLPSLHFLKQTKRENLKLWITKELLTSIKKKNQIYKNSTELRMIKANILCMKNFKNTVTLY